MTDARSLSFHLPALKLLMVGQPGRGGKSCDDEASGWGRDLSHLALGGYLQIMSMWTKLPTAI